MKKIFKNSSGNIEVRESSENKYGNVELIQNLGIDIKVLGYWIGGPIPHFISVDKNFIETKYDFDIFKALKFGQKLAEILIETNDK